MLSGWGMSLLDFNMGADVQVSQQKSGEQKGGA
jgi:hypothetical protein